MAMEWTEQLSIGNEILDSDHRQLFGLASDIECAVKAMDHPALARAYELLKGCMDRHFLNEELFAHALNIPFAEHHLDHQNILAGIDIMRREMGKNIEESIFVIEHYTQFLQDWLIKHITEKDLLMKPVLQAYPSNFKIEGVFA